MSSEAQDKPIPGSSPVGPDYPWEPDWDRPVNFPLKVGRFLIELVRTPVHWVRANIVEPSKGPKYYWYHRKYKRALPVDECYIDDLACIHEANLEYKRNYYVDRATLDLLRYRRDYCNFWQATKEGGYVISDKCKDISDTYKREELNFFIKYGEMTWNSTVIHAFNKQKHRMIVERRRELMKAKAEEEAAENS